MEETPFPNKTKNDSREENEDSDNIEYCDCIMYQIPDFKFVDAHKKNGYIRKENNIMEDWLCIGVDNPSKNIDVFLNKGGWSQRSLDDVYEKATNDDENEKGIPHIIDFLVFNREQVAELIPKLQKFVDTGEFDPEEKKHDR